MALVAGGILPLLNAMRPPACRASNRGGKEPARAHGLKPPRSHISAGSSGGGDGAVINAAARYLSVFCEESVFRLLLSAVRLTGLLEQPQRVGIEAPYRRLHERGIRGWHGAGPQPLPFGLKLRSQQSGRARTRAASSASACACGEERPRRIGRGRGDLSRAMALGLGRFHRAAM